jgi:hypothetical protein
LFLGHCPLSFSLKAFQFFLILSIPSLFLPFSSFTYTGGTTAAADGLSISPGMGWPDYLFLRDGGTDFTPLILPSSHLLDSLRFPPPYDGKPHIPYLSFHSSWF